jgi:hypothetical protein
VQQNFCAFLRCVDNLLQPLTLGISPASRQNEEVTTAKYRELPAAVGPVRGTGTSEWSLLLLLQMNTFLAEAD